MTLIESFLENSPDDLEKLLDVYIDGKTEDRYHCDSSNDGIDWRRIGIATAQSYSTCQVDGLAVDIEREEQLKEIAHQLKKIASGFHLERKGVDEQQLKGLHPDEISIIREIFTLYQPSVSDIADTVLKNLTPATLGFTLDLLIKSANDRQSQIGLPFDLIGAMYVLRGAVNIPSWVKKSCLHHIKQNILLLK